MSTNTDFAKRNKDHINYNTTMINIVDNIRSSLKIMLTHRPGSSMSKQYGYQKNGHPQLDPLRMGIHDLTSFNTPPFQVPQLDPLRMGLSWPKFGIVVSIALGFHLQFLLMQAS